MSRSIAPLCLALALAACGGREPGPHAGERQLWTISVAERTFDACTDEPDFRDDLDSLSGLDGSYFAYEVSEDGKTARSMACTDLHVSRCEVEAEGLTFAVVDSHLLYAETARAPLKYTDGTVSKCELELNLNWDMNDLGETMEGTATFLYGLVGDVTECASFEEQMVAASGNGEGVDGCSVGLKMTGTLP